MKRRRLLLMISLAVAACVVTFGVLAMLPPRPGITKTNFDSIEIGMHEKEVEALLGEPGNRGFRNRNDPFWNGDGCSTTVIFDRDNRVIRKEWREWERSVLQIFREFLWTTRRRLATQN